MKKGLLSIIAMAVLMVISAVGYAQTTYTKVNSVSELEAGAQYLLVGFDADGNAFVMSYQKTNNRHAIAVDEAGGSITTTVASDPASQTEPYEFTLGGSAGAWTIFDPLNNGYLYAPGGGNYLKTQGTLDDKGQWTITEGEDGGFVPVSNGGAEQSIMRYNIQSTLFGCYKESSSVSALVYFYKAGGGTPVIYPEPSNYPTNFTATLDGMDITLTWTDATGDQLPSKYLVIGSTGSITVPTDGTPVANDVLVANVNYGIQEVTFDALDPNTTYHFAIFPYTNSGANIDYKTNGTYPTAQATTPNVQILLDEEFNNDLGVFTAYNAYGEQEWHQGSYQGTSYANMNGYAAGAAHENEDWLISPEMTIGQLGSSDGVYLAFRNAKKFDGDPLRVLVSTDYTEGDDPAAIGWIDITDAFDFSTDNYEWVESGSVDIRQIVENAGRFHVAFLYTSTDEAASSWEIDWVTIIVADLTSVSENTVSTIDVYPNPAHEMVSFSLSDDAQVSVYDMTGRVVSDSRMSAGVNNINVAQLESGIYFINVRYADNKTQVSRFVKF